MKGDDWLMINHNHMKGDDWLMINHNHMKGDDWLMINHNHMKGDDWFRCVKCGYYTWFRAASRSCISLHQRLSTSISVNNA